MRSIKRYMALVSMVALLSCSNDNNGGGAPQNVDPTIPVLVFPTNNLTCTSIDLGFSWNASTDADGDTISYVIEISTDPGFGSVAFTVNTTQRTRTFDLKKGVTYFWRVKARDSQGNESAYSSPQSFFTEPDAAINTLPNAPTLVSPGIGSRITGASITLDWDATDADGDALSYDVYFGDTDSPVLVEEGMTASELEVSVSPSTIYYWRVVVKDSNQNASMSQLWNFRTE